MTEIESSTCCHREKVKLVKNSVTNFNFETTITVGPYATPDTMIDSVRETKVSSNKINRFITLKTYLFYTNAKIDNKISIKTLDDDIVINETS
jgi:hypothetical protein